MSDPLQVIMEERARQDQKWGEQNHGDERWHLILGEEVGEVAKAILERRVSGEIRKAMGRTERGLTDEEIRAEIVQVAAVALAWLECIERRGKERKA